MCGEHVTIPEDALLTAGSSPHVRGAPQNMFPCSVELGIIPACAGSTRDARKPPIEVGDHPRMCGEHLYPSASTAFIAGSSPHVRGAPPRTACTTSRPRDHPRMCGEHDSADLPGMFQTGSSPHVRGAPRWTGPGHAEIGIIPACAGSTTTRNSHQEHQGDHPRMCGEH